MDQSSTIFSVNGANGQSSSAQPDGTLPYPHNVPHMPSQMIVPNHGSQSAANFTSTPYATQPGNVANFAQIYQGPSPQGTVSLTEQNARATSHQDGFCSYHSENVDYVCRTCQLNLCYRCLADGRHREHGVQSLKDLNAQCAQQIFGMRQNLQAKYGQFRLSYNQIEQRRIHKGQRWAQYKAYYQQEEVKLHNTLTKQTANFLRKIKRKFTNEVKAVDGLMRETRGKAQGVEEILFAQPQPCLTAVQLLAQQEKIIAALQAQATFDPLVLQMETTEKLAKIQRSPTPNLNSYFERVHNAINTHHLNLNIAPPPMLTVLKDLTFPQNQTDRPSSTSEMEVNMSAMSPIDHADARIDGQLVAVAADATRNPSRLTEEAPGLSSTPANYQDGVAMDYSPTVPAAEAPFTVVDEETAVVTTPPVTHVIEDSVITGVASQLCSSSLPESRPTDVRSYQQRTIEATCTLDVSFNSNHKAAEQLEVEVQRDQLLRVSSDFIKAAPLPKSCSTISTTSSTDNPTERLIYKNMKNESQRVDQPDDFSAPSAFNMQQSTSRTETFAGHIAGGTDPISTNAIAVVEGVQTTSPAVETVTVVRDGREKTIKVAVHSALDDDEEMTENCYVIVKTECFITE